MDRIEIDTEKRTFIFDGAICAFEALDCIFHPAQFRSGRSYTFSREPFRDGVDIIRVNVIR